MINFAAVGLGQMGVVNARAIKNTKNSNLLAVVEPNVNLMNKVSKSLNVKAYKDIEDVLKIKKVDAVFLSVPHNVHFKLAKKVLNAGKHLIIEKPFVLDIGEGEELIKLAEEKKCLISSNYCFRFLPPVIYAKEIVSQGCIGELIGTNIQVHQEKDIAYWLGLRGDSPNDWRSDREKSGGGMLMMTTCHHLDFVHYIINSEITSISCKYATKKAPGDCEDILSMTYSYENGGIGNLFTSANMKSSRAEYIELWGTKGTIRFDRSTLEFYSSRMIDKKRPAKWHTIKFKESPAIVYVTSLVENFADSIGGKDNLIVDAKSSIYNVKVINSAYHSSENDKFVTVD